MNVFLVFFESMNEWSHAWTSASLQLVINLWMARLDEGSAGRWNYGH